MLVRLARHAEIGLGQMVEKESHGLKLLVVRGQNGNVAVMDAHCFHMGAALVGGDIEDLAGHVCVVCPAHKYRVSASENFYAIPAPVVPNLPSRPCRLTPPAGA
jgi:nitrite reductase/ring-hydroxylating ferredoxin subunit